MSDFKSFEGWNGYARMGKAKKAGIEQKQTKGTKQAEPAPTGKRRVKAGLERCRAVEIIMGTCHCSDMAAFRVPASDFKAKREQKKSARYNCCSDMPMYRGVVGIDY